MTEQPSDQMSSSDLADPGDENLGRKTRAGARWQVISQVIELGSAMGVMLLLAHYVSPSEFGVIAWGTAVVAILVGVLVSPVGSAIVAKQFPAGTALDTAWWFALVPCFVLYVATVLISVALGLDSLGLTVVIGVGISLPFMASRQIVISHLQQRLSFGSLAVSRIVGAALSTLLSLGFLVLGDPVLALIARTTSAPLFQTLYAFTVVEWVPRVRIDRAVLREIYAYAKGLAGFNAVNQFSRKGDDIIVGGLVGTHALGLYSIAYRFIEVPVGQVGLIAENVAFPSIVRVKEADRMRAVFLRSQRMLVWLAAPLSIAAVALGDLAIPAFLGSDWTDAGPIVQIFGPIAYLQIAGTLAGIIYLYKGATGLLMRWGIAATMVNLVCFIVGSKWGAIGVAWGYLAASIILFYPSWFVPGRLIELRPAVVLRSLFGVTSIAAVISVGIFALRQLIPLTGVIQLSLVIIGLTLVFWILSLILIPPLRRDVITTLTARI